MGMKSGVELVPGGLAIIKHSARLENIGRMVTAVQRFAPHEQAVLGDRVVFGGIARWLVEVQDGADPLILPRREGGYDLDVKGICRESWLIPINPSADPLEISQQMEEKV